MKKLLAFLIILFVLIPSCFSMENFENENVLFKKAQSAWLEGRPNDAAGTLKYIVLRTTDTAKSLKAIRQLSIILSELGKPQEALAYLSKAEVINSSDPYTYFEKGWNYLALEEYSAARKAFEKVLPLTVAPDLVAQTRFGLAMAEIELTGPASAIKKFESVYHRFPYLISPATQMISKCYAKIKKRQHSVIFLQKALEYDPKNIQALTDLAFLYDTVGYYMQAWQTFYTLREMSPDEPFFIKKTKKLSKHIKGKKDNLLYWTRLAWPVHKTPLKYYGKKKIRIALYADEKGKPAPIESFNFIVNTDFIIEDSVLGKASEGKANSQWTVKYNPLNRIYEITDNKAFTVHSTRRKFKIIPKIKGGIILIKNPVLTVEKGINRGDKEITGELNLVPKINVGLIMINKTPIENCIASIVSQLAPDKKLDEELKTFAVVIRTKMLKMFYSKKSSSPYYDISDSAYDIVFPGLQVENPSAVQAAKSTRGEVLYRKNSLSNAKIHTACGGSTDKANDRGSKPSTLTPFNFYNWTLKSPPDDLYCLPNNKQQSSNVYWTLLLDTKWIEKRANNKYKIGKLKSLSTLKRKKDGRVETLKIEGTANTVIIRGTKKISYILASGSLRSSIFNIRPIFNGKYPQYFILRGIGTGEGKGLCAWGAHGMAKNLGYKYRKILKHYFPKLKIKKLRL
jgi:stage II sporulation protein D (peptidoglycan lytic transglycosylase)